MSKMDQLVQIGQSIWLDDIRRSYFDTGFLKNLIDLGLRGMTSNPTIFEKSIAQSADYEADMKELNRKGRSIQEIYEALSIEDIRQAADLLGPVYDETGGTDGFVSLEVNPELAHNTNATVAEACRLFWSVQRPNLMIKIPATPEGLLAITETISRGINVNVTLIFSINQYKAVAEAYLSGLELLADSGERLDSVSSVASFFVSRIDTAVDKELQEIIRVQSDLTRSSIAHQLLGRIAIANAKAAYVCFQEIFSSKRWLRLEASGARMQRPLWASTSAKNPAYSDLHYVDNLIGSNTINTLPPATLKAFLDHGQTSLSINLGIDQAYTELNQLADIGVDLGNITDALLEEGVKAFTKSFITLMSSIADKRNTMLSGKRDFSVSLGEYQSVVDHSLTEMVENRIIERIWAGDHTVWKEDPTEITNRLGWLQVADRMMAHISELESFTHDLHLDGFTHVLLLGMGGSSLAPEVFSKSFGVCPSHLQLVILDSTVPGAILDCTEKLDPAKTLFLVSSKSGNTVETYSLLKYFYRRIIASLGEKEAGAHFAVITDPGSYLEEISRQFSFRACFLNDANIGGRYSALSFFGLLPAALIGIDLAQLLERARSAMRRCQDCSSVLLKENYGVYLGVILAELSKAGKDKLTLITSPAVCTFGDWIEQLVAESTGKEGQGILPVVGEMVAQPDKYGSDRIFVYLQLEDDYSHETSIRALEYSGFPVVRMHMQDLYDLGAQFFLWEMATVVAGSRLGIQPFDQPNVEEAKVRTRDMVTAYKTSSALPLQEPVFSEDGVSVYGNFSASSLPEAWRNFLTRAEEGAYAAIQVYLPPSKALDASVTGLKTVLRSTTKLAVTSGYGPRYLHSTGQLHKGDNGKGLFIQLTADHFRDVPIPDELDSDSSTISFGVLEMAQVLGDGMVLMGSGRKVIRFHLGKNPLVGLARITQALTK